MGGLEGKHRISPEMTVLEILSNCRKTESVFKKYDHQAGECICCNALFEPLEKVAVKHGLNLKGLICELEAACKGSQ
jgi:hypothetical protein